MSPERWRQIDERFLAAAALPATERANFLDNSCLGDDLLRREVEALLASDGEEEGSLDEIASGVAAEWAEQNRAQDLLGQALGRYQILAPLGIGGMGEVYLAQDTTLDRKVAIKLLPRQFTQDRDRLRRFEQEARAASALNHPNIITIYEVGQWDGSNFIATEYIEGETLSGNKRTFPIAELLEVGVQISSALAAAHTAGIVHRDIKPANIMLRKDGYIKVLDFGLAKLNNATPQPDFTEAGRVLGTINYMSPEQALGKPLDQRTDIFSLGVVLYELAIGQRPFGGKTDAETYDCLLNKNPPPLKQFDTTLPIELEQVLRRALEKKPESRYQTAEELGADLKRLAQGQSQTDAARMARRALRSRNWRNAMLAAVALIVISLGYFLLHQKTPPLPKSIAILPFENLSEEKATEYFTDGIQDEIMTRLSKIADLKVISRTSTQHYKSAPDNLPEIARQLGVAHILEGSVQKSGDAVRVNVKLIKAANDSHLWAETFDRKLTDIFLVESEVAKSIAEQLRAQITGPEERVLEAKPTNSPEAYDAYLRGLAYTLKSAITPGTTLSAQKYLREAVRLDPKFALAWALLSYTESRGYRTHALPSTAELREEARAAAETALTIQPDLGEAVLAKGYYHYSCLGDYDTATSYLERAFQLMPNNSRIPESLAYVSRRRGQWEKSRSYFKQAQQLDPRNVSLLTQWANTEIMVRHFSAASEKVEQILNVIPDDPDTLALKAGIAQATGELAQAAALLAPLRPKPDDINATEVQIYQAILERDPSSILPRLQEVLSKPEPAPGIYAGELRFWLGWLQQVAGDQTAAIASWKQALSELEPLLKEQPGNQRLIMDLCLTNICLGNKEAAFSLVDRALKVTPVEKDALDGPQAIELLARAAAVTGEPDRAIDALEKLLAIPYEGLFAVNVPMTRALLRLDPMFDSIRGEPRFQKLVAE